jgi:hypothetical protein
MLTPKKVGNPKNKLFLIFDFLFWLLKFQTVPKGNLRLFSESTESAFHRPKEKMYNGMHQVLYATRPEEDQSRLHSMTAY